MEKATRWKLLELLKREGPQSADGLAEQLGITAMAVRQHLYALQQEQLVAHTAEPRPVGRPAKLWRLTPAADQLFHNGHADLTVSLLEAMGQAFGREGMERLLAARTRQQVESYRRRTPSGPLGERLAALAQARTEEGYMAEVLEQEDGSYLLVENHCPICTAARACMGLCGAELQVFQEVLGSDVEVDRTEHILAGSRRCAYRVAPVPASRRAGRRINIRALS
jgi:predicted ArsR family transcriptional regulator